MDLTLFETSAYIELKRRLSSLSGKVAEFCRKIEPVTPEKWLDAQDVCLKLHLSKRTLQTYRDRGDIPYSNIGGKFFYREADIAKILEKGIKMR